jgi:hypothetical protein
MACEISVWLLPVLVALAFHEAVLLECNLRREIAG